MTKNFKLNQRAELLDENAENFAFIIAVTAPNAYNAADFKIIESKYKNPPPFNAFNDGFINFNEWKIHFISSVNYFGRLGINIQYQDPKGVTRKFWSGGETMERTPENAINFLQRQLRIFFQLSFYKSFKDAADEGKYIGELV